MTLQERLRAEALATEELHPDDSEIEVMREAADEIDRLTRELSEARALESHANKMGTYILDSLAIFGYDLGRN